MKSRIGMTTTDGLLSQNSSTFGGSVPANSSVPQKFNVNDIVMHFGREYYTMLSCEPERLHCFYGKQSSLLHCQEEDVEAPVCIGLEEIHQRIVSMRYNGARVVISNIDCQPSMNGCILIFVIGTMHWTSGVARKFVQTFLLAEQPNGYFILNDIMRLPSFFEPAKADPPAIPKTTATQPVAAPIPADPAPSVPVSARSSAPVSAAAPAVASTVPPTVNPQKPAERPAERPAEKAAEESVPEKKTSQPRTGRSGAPVPPPTPAVSAEKTAQAAPTPAKPKEEAPPSSWAKLAAVQQNRWQSGIVAESKGPVASIPVAAPPAADAKQKGGENGNSSAGGAGGRAGHHHRSSGEGRGEQKESTRRERTRHERPERSDSHSHSHNYDFSKSIYVSGIVGRIEPNELRKVFEPFGKIKTFEGVFNRGIAFVEFETAEGHAAALQGKPVYNNAPVSVEARRISTRKERDTAPAVNTASTSTPTLTATPAPTPTPAPTNTTTAPAPANTGRRYYRSAANGAARE